MCTRTLVSHFSSPDHKCLLNNVSVTHIDKSNPYDPLRHGNFWQEHFTMALYWLNIEDLPY